MINPIRRFIWTKLKRHEIPNWVWNAALNFEHRYYATHGHRPYNIVTYSHGKTFEYKVYFKTLGQGKINMIVFKKLRYFKI